MNMPEGNTLNVPELRRLMADLARARQQLLNGHFGVYRPAFEDLTDALMKAAPALLDVVEAAQRYDSGIPGHAIKDFISGEHEPYCAACALHAALTRLEGPS